MDIEDMFVLAMSICAGLLCLVGVVFGVLLLATQTGILNLG